MRVLSIQSAVSVGHVGNAVAVPALQRLGHEVWRIDTVAFSNHPGHGRFRGSARPPEEVMELVEGIAEHGWFAECDAVLSGYLGAPGTAAAVARAVDLLKAESPAAVPGSHAGGIYCCDPVIGDHGRVFVQEGVEVAVRETLVPKADLLTPNVFELGRLAGTSLGDDSEVSAIAAVAQGVSDATGGLVVVTGIVFGKKMGALLAEPGGPLVFAGAERRARSFNGTGDLFAALMLGWFLRDGDARLALCRAIAGIDAVTGLTEARGATELALIDALDDVVDTGRAAELEPILGE